MQLPLRTVQPAENAKYLRVFFDRNLNWKTQQEYAVRKGAKWAAQIRRLARPTWGITPKYAKRLFTSVALPRIMYAIDIWCTPTDSEHAGPKAIGTAVTTGYALGSKRPTLTDSDRCATPQDAVSTAVMPVVHDARRNMLGE